MTQAKTWVGLDVHVSGTVAAVLDRDSGELRRRRLSGRGEEIAAFVAGLAGPVGVTYEAGPTGFALARRLAAAGVDCLVCAPGLIPRGPSDRVKTDQRDAERLVRLLVAGELHRVAVPTVEEEALRDLVRAREDLRGDLMRARHRLAKLLLRHDVRFDGPERNWTRAHLRWLTTVTFDQPGSQRAFEDYLGGVEALLVRRGQLERDIAELLPTSPWAQTAQRLMCLRGIDTLSAAGLCAEIGDFTRFRHPEQVMSYLGVTPSERSSGSQRRLGPITKSGSQHARRLLVEAAWHYRRAPGVSTNLRRRRPARTQRSSRCRGRPSGACITSGRACSSATSAGQSSPSRPLASSPDSAGRSRPPTERHARTLIEEAAGTTAGFFAQSTRDTPMGSHRPVVTPDARRRALRRNPGPAVANPRISV